MSKKLKWILIILAAAALTSGAYFVGRRSEKRITWYSELGMRTHGVPIYFHDTEVRCANGKDIGRLTIDLNLRNGELKVVRNDSKLEPNCDPTVLK